MCILRVRTWTVRQLAEECILRRQSRFIKSGEAVHVVIGIYPFPFYELKFVSNGKGLPHVFELINFEGLHETVQTLRSELERVDELEPVHSDGEILLHVLWNYPHLPKFTLQRFDNQVPIIALEVIPTLKLCTLEYTYYAPYPDSSPQCGNDHALCPLPVAGFLCGSWWQCGRSVILPR